MNALETYYHATMQDFERQTRDKSARLNKIREISRKEKREILRERAHQLDEWFSIERIHEHVSFPTHFANHNEFIRYLSNFPLQHCFRLRIQPDEQFPCPLLQGNIAWIHRNPDGHVRYYSKRKGDLSIAFDLLDIVEIAKGLSTVEALSEIAKQTGAVIKEQKGSQKLRVQYHENVTIYQNFMQSTDPIVNKFLQPLMDVYTELQMVASSRADDWFKGQHIFFASTRFLSARVGQTTHTTVAKILNTLHAIGAIQRLELQEIPAVCQVRSQNWMNYMGYRHAVSYFVIPPLQTMLDTIEKRVHLIKEKGWNYGHFSRNRLNELLSEEKVYTDNEKWLLDSLRRNLLLRKYASKESVLSNVPFCKKEATLILDENWKMWIQQEGCVYKRPTAEQKKTLYLKSSVYIAWRE